MITHAGPYITQAFLDQLNANFAAISGGGTGVVSGPTPPATPADNEMWWSTDLGQLFIWYNDGDSTQWVPASVTGGTLSSTSSFGSLVDAATIAVNMMNNADFVGVLAGDRVLGNPLNAKPGSRGSLFLRASGAARTIGLSSNWRPQTGVEAFPLSIATNETVRIDYIVESSSVLWINNVGRRGS
jgi:hypothetical protein